MQRLLNTLYVSTQGAYLHKDGQSVVVKIDGQERLRVPIHNLSGIVCFGNVLCSPFLLGFCADQQVAVSFLTEHGRFLASVQGPVNGNVLLRRAQYRVADNAPWTLGVVKAVVAGKLVNTRHALRRAAREQPRNAQPLGVAADRVRHLLQKLEAASDTDTVRGYEGEAARTYFSSFNLMIARHDSGFAFAQRTRRPPLDPVNALLSFVYTLLLHDLTGAVEAHGLDPCVGYLHRDRPGRKGLALDLMEEFRACFADRLVLALINRQQVKPQGFLQSESGAVLMDEETRKTVLTAYQKRKQEHIQHPFLGEKMPLGMIFHAQALLFARHVRAELDAYPPFHWK